MTSLTVLRQTISHNLDIFWHLFQSALFEKKFDFSRSMPSCCVPGCKSRFLNKPNDIQFFSFPFKYPEQCALWAKAIGRGNWKPTKWTKICSLHFTAKDYMPRFPGVIGYLRKNAVPSQMIGSLCNSEMDDYQNSSMSDGESFKLSMRSNVETAEKQLLPIDTQTVKSTPQPIALIKVLHNLPTSVVNQKQTEQILPHGVSDAIVNEKRNESADILQQKVSNAIVNGKRIQRVDVSPQKVTDAIVNEKRIQPVDMSPQKATNAINNVKKAQSVDILPRKVSNAIVNERRIQPINLLRHKVSNAVVSDKRPELIKIVPLKLANVNEKSSVPIKKLCGNVKILQRQESHGPINVKQQHLKIDSAHHTLRIIPVKDSDPLLAIRCPLSNQETYMALPIKSLSNKNNDASTMQIDNEETARTKSPEINSDPEQVLTQKQNLNDLSEIDALKNEIIKLNQTINRQKKRMQYIVQMRRSSRGHKRVE